MVASFSAPTGAPPVNDSFAAAQSLAGWAPPLVRTATTFATVEADEPSQTTVSDPKHCRMVDTLWYRYTPPADGLLTIDLAGSPLYRAVNLWRGTTKANLSPVACDDGTTASVPPRIADVPVTKGQSLYIQVGGYHGTNGPTRGDVDMSLVPAPADERRPRRTRASVTDRTTTHNIFAGTATVEASEPRNAACPAMTSTALVPHHSDPGQPAQPQHRDQRLRHRQRPCGSPPVGSRRWPATTT